MRLAREALSLARETRDPDALALVLSRGWVLIDGSTPFLDELKALNDEAEAVAREVGDPVRLADALHDGAYYAACRGDRADVRSEARRGGADLRHAAPPHVRVDHTP